MNNIVRSRLLGRPAFHHLSLLACSSIAILLAPREKGSLVNDAIYFISGYVIVVGVLYWILKSISLEARTVRIWCFAVAIFFCTLRIVEAYHQINF